MIINCLFALTEKLEHTTKIGFVQRDHQLAARPYFEVSKLFRKLSGHAITAYGIPNRLQEIPPALYHLLI